MSILDDIIRAQRRQADYIERTAAVEYGGAGGFPSGIVPVANGGTGIASYTIGDMLYASGATTLSKLADVAAGSYLRSGGVGVAPLWSTLTLPNAATTGDLLYASSANTIGNLLDVATGNALISGGVGTAPLWGKIALTTHVSGVLPIANGGTNSSTALSGSAIMISNGSAIVQGAAGTTVTVLHGNAAGAPTYSAVSLTADITGTLAATNGGTGVSNAGTITNATNITFTGGGTLALGGFTLTVAGTGTAATGTGATSRVAFWSGTNTLSSAATFATDGVTVGIGSAMVATQSLRITSALNDGTGPNIGIQVAPTSTGNVAVGFYGINAAPGFAGTGGTLTVMYGLSMNPIIGAAATSAITTVHGLLVRIDNNSTGGAVVATANGLAISTPVATGAITSVRGINLGVQTTGTNNTNLLIGVGTTGNWNIYSNSAYDSYFAGNIGVGTNAPVSLLDVSSATGGIATLSRADTSATAADVIGKVQFWNNDSQLVTQNIFANIEVQASVTVATDAAAGLMLFRTTGTTVAGAPVEAMRITAGQAVTFASATGGFGYGTGAGGIVTQATNKATGVTLSTVTGQITMNNAALAAATTVSFVLTNTAIAATDVLLLNHISAGTAGAYLLNAQSAAGSATINVRNVTAGSLSEAIVIAYVVVKAVTA